MAITKAIMVISALFVTPAAFAAAASPVMPMNYSPRIMPMPLAWSSDGGPRPEQVAYPAKTLAPIARPVPPPVKCKYHRRQLRFTGAWVTEWDCMKLAWCVQTA